jgi:hypothetical protein
MSSGGLPRPVSMILEEPEDVQDKKIAARTDTVTAKKKKDVEAAKKENKHPFNNVPSLFGTTFFDTPKKAAETKGGGGEVEDKTPVTVATPSGTKVVREEYEWPDDVF